MVVQEGQQTGDDVVCQQLFESAMTIFSKKKVLRSLAAEALVAIMEQVQPETFLKHFGKLLSLILFCAVLLWLTIVYLIIQCHHLPRLLEGLMRKLRITTQTIY